MKKKKLTEAELAREREERIQATAQRLKMIILKMEKQKNEFFAKVLEARQKGLPAQEEQARGLMRKCMATYQQANAMLMTLELAVQSRDLAELNKQFVECIGSLSQDMTVNTKKTNIKKTEKQYLEALYKAGQQTQQLDQMLELGQYAQIATAETDKFTEFDTEIDGMLEQAGLSATIPGSNTTKIR